MSQEINESLEAENASLKKQLSDALYRLENYEQNGAAKLYYSLQRKMNEMAELLNNKNLAKVDMVEVKDKTFDRLKVIWNDAASIAIAVKELGIAAGVTGDEKKDVERKPFVDRIAEKRD